MMSKILLEQPQSLRLADAECLYFSDVKLPVQCRHRKHTNPGLKTLLAGLLLSAIGCPLSSPGAQRQVTGTPRVADAHITVNFSQLAQLEAITSKVQMRTNKTVAPFMTPMGLNSNPPPPGAASPRSAQAPVAGAAAASPL